MYIGPSRSEIELALGMLRANPNDAQYARYLLDSGKHPILALRNVGISLTLRLHYGVIWAENAVKMALEVIDRNITP